MLDVFHVFWVARVTVVVGLGPIAALAVIFRLPLIIDLCTASVI